MATMPFISYWDVDGMRYQLVSSGDPQADPSQQIELNDLSAIAREGDRVVISALRATATGHIRLTFNRAMIRIELVERFLAAVHEHWPR